MDAAAARRGLLVEEAVVIHNAETFAEKIDFQYL
jgi:hypothetical protein